jgi:hypothetical protein
MGLNGELRLESHFGGFVFFESPLRHDAGRVTDANFNARDNFKEYQANKQAVEKRSINKHYYGVVLHIQK